MLKNLKGHSVQMMLITILFPIWMICFIIALTMTSSKCLKIAIALFASSLTLLGLSLQYPEHTFILEIASIICFLCSLIAFYETYIQDKLEEYRKQMEQRLFGDRDLISPPVDYISVFLKKIWMWLKDP